MITHKFTVADKTIILDPSTIALLSVEGSQISIVLHGNPSPIYHMFDFHTNKNDNGKTDAHEMFDKITYAWEVQNKYESESAEV